MKTDPAPQDDPLQPIREPILPGPAPPAGHEDLKARVAALEDENAALKNRVEDLEEWVRNPLSVQGKLHSKRRRRN